MDRKRKNRVGAGLVLFSLTAAGVLSQASLVKGDSWCEYDTGLGMCVDVAACFLVGEEPFIYSCHGGADQECHCVS